MEIMMRRPGVPVALTIVSLASSICLLVAAVACGLGAKWVLTVIFAILAVSVGVIGVSITRSTGGI